MKTFSEFLTEEKPIDLDDPEVLFELAAMSPEEVPSRIKRELIYETEESACYVLATNPDYIKRFHKDPKDAKSVVAKSQVTLVKIWYESGMSERWYIPREYVPNLVGALKKVK